jgi:phospholipid/cholesterol/gamma-HCH transport system ATP-binding protein
MNQVMLEVNNLWKSFDHKNIHQGVSFQLFKGETIGLLGHSGSGKSVLLRSLIGLEEIDQGEIHFMGQRIDHLPEEDYCQLRQKISYSFQNGALFDSLTVSENIAYPLMEHTQLSDSEIENKITSLLRLIQMEGASELMPSELSGGMQKRVGLARSIALSPSVILYDEPTAGLDPINTENILNLMQQFKLSGYAGIFVTHDMPAARKICDRILLLREGKIYFSGTIQDFDQSPDPFVRSFSNAGERDGLPKEIS